MDFETTCKDMEQPSFHLFKKLAPKKVSPKS